MSFCIGLSLNSLQITTLSKISQSKSRTMPRNAFKGTIQARRRTNSSAEGYDQGVPPLVPQNGLGAILNDCHGID